MKKLFLPIIVTISLLMTSRVFFHNPETAVHSFFAGYGFELSQKVVEVTEYTIPNTMTDVLENYNKLQKKAGLDLTPYMGKTTRRYTFRVLNFPFETDCEVRANALVYKNRVIAADIMTVNLDGFMLSPADEVFFSSGT